jgi:hypothetical protein
MALKLSRGLNWRYALLSSLLMTACSSTSGPDAVLELGELDTSGSVLAENPAVLAIGDLKISVRIVTAASECARRFETIVAASEIETVVEPMVEVPAHCSSRTAKLFDHYVIVTRPEPGAHDVVVRALGGDGRVVLIRRTVDVT